MAKANQNAGIIMLALAILGSGSYVYQVKQFSDQANCQADVNLAVSKNIRIRSDIASQDTQAKTRLLDGMGTLLLLPPSKDKKVNEKRVADFLELFRDFKKTMSSVETARAENPVPELRDGQCD